MADFILTPNMGLPEPIVGQTTGTAYATYINQSLTLIDRHDHTPGNGVQITPAGLNINSTVDFQGNSVIDLTGANFELQSIDPTLAQTLYVKDGSETIPLPDLWYFDGNTHIQITSNGQTATTLANLPGQTYAAGTFTWRQGAGSTTPAQFDIGSIIIRPTTAGASTGVTLVAPPAANFTLTFPTALPVTQSLVTIDSSGNIATPFSVSGGLSGSALADNSVTNAKLVNKTVDSTKIADGGLVTSVYADGSVTRVKQAPVGEQYSSSSPVTYNPGPTFAVVTNLSVTITTTGRPVIIMLVNGAISMNGGNGDIGISNTGGSTFFCIYNINGTLNLPSSVINTVDFPAAGTYNYTVSARVNASTMNVSNCHLLVYEL